MPVTKSTLNKRKASSIEEMQQVAANQVDQRIMDLQEHIDCLRRVKDNIHNVVDNDSYDYVVSDLESDEDVNSLDALKELGEYYETMKAGDYF